MNILAKCVSGFYQLLQSPSGVFSLLALIAIVSVTWHAPIIGAAGIAAFAAIVPACLGFFEHKETMATIQQTPATIVQTVIDNVKGQI